MHDLHRPRNQRRAVLCLDGALPCAFSAERVFLPLPLTNARVLVACVPCRWLACKLMTTSCIKPGLDLTAKMPRVQFQFYAPLCH